MRMSIQYKILSHSYSLRRQMLIRGFLHILIFSWILMFFVSVQAASFTVNSTVDAVDANPGDGICETAPGNGICTLRAAIQETNEMAGADTIILPAATYNLEIAGFAEDLAATGDLDILDDLTIEGAGAVSTIVDGGGLDRVLEVHFSSTVQITDLTIQNGFENAPASASGGGIRNDGNLTLTRIIITGNRANEGGGIKNLGTLTLDKCTVSGNTTEDLGITNQYGGGINGRTGPISITNSTISGNQAGSGGGIWISGVILTIANSTLSINSGGGLRNQNGTVTLDNVTFKDNDSYAISNFICDTCPGGITLKNTIVADSTGSNCSGTAITSLGNNLDSGTSCGFASSGDLSDTDPLLGPLADNGGPTQTHALLAVSPAIDAGDNISCQATDQRGELRPFDGNNDGTSTCDIGAYELSLITLDIKANGTNGPVTPTPTDNLSVTVALNPGSQSGENADWWAAAATPLGWFYLDASTMLWVLAGASYTDLIVTHQSSLFNLPTIEILNIPVSVLPPGTYTFYFAVDMNMNGLLDFDELFFDSVVVNIMP